MASLTDRFAVAIAALKAERERIVVQAAENIAEVDARLDVLAEAQKLVTKELEGAYAGLLRLGLIREIT